MTRFRSARLDLLRVAIVVAATGLPFAASAQSILSVAGGGTDDGRLATEVRLGEAFGLVRMPDGALVLSEMAAHRIRRVDPATCRISTLAGNGIGTFAGDGGPAPAASFSNPTALLLHDGGLLVADAGNGRVRRVDLVTLEVSTWAGGGDAPGDGGPARSARFSCPVGLARTSGGILVADACAFRIRRIDAATGVVTTVAGTGEYGFSGDGGPATAARLGNPRAIAVDRAGDLLIVDTCALRIRRVKAATGIIETIAGDGSQVFREGALALETGFLAPYSVAEDADGNLWAGDTGRLVRIAAADGRVHAVTQVGIASGLLPEAGKLLVADGLSLASEVFQLDRATGARVRLAGGGAGGIGDGGPATAAVLAFPYDVAPAPDGGLLVPEVDGLRVRKFRPGGTIETIAGTGSTDGPRYGVPATAASLAQPAAVAADAAGNVYVGSPEGVVRLDASSGLLTRFAGGGESNAGDGGPATAVHLSAPWKIAVDGRGGLLIAEFGANRVRRVDLSTGIISTVAGTGVAGFSGDGGPATAARLNGPAGLDVDANGNIYLADSSNSRIRKISAVDGAISTVAGGGPVYPTVPVRAVEAQLPGLWSLASDGMGRLVFNVGAGLARFDPATGLVSPLGPIQAYLGMTGDGGPLSAATFGSIRGLRFDSSGNLFVADGGSNRIRAVFACVTVGAPSLSVPADGATGTSTGPTLTWSSVAGAFRYDVYLGTTNPPTTAVATDLAATNFTPVNLQPGTKYSWKVVAKGDPYCVPFSSTESVVRSFTTIAGCAAPSTPSLTAPADGAKVPAAAATLTWAASSGAGTYDVSFGATNPPPLAASGLTSTSFTPPALDVGGLYYWSVLARAACDPAKTASSGVRSFRIEGVGCFPPGAFSLSAPADGATGLPPDLTISWTTSQGAASYDLYLGLTASPPLYLSGLTSTALALRGLAAGATYRWKVVARAACDPAAVAATPVRTFTVRGTCATPGATGFTFLPPGAIGTGQGYVVAWSAASGLDAGDGYVVERSTSPSFSPVLDTVTTSTLFASFVAPASAGSLYHRVRAIPACDPEKAGPWSPTGLVSVTAATPNVVFSRAPEAMVVALGDRLEDQKSLFTLENVTSSPIQVFLGRQELSSPPFFTVTDPSGGDAAVLTLEPHVPKLLEVHYSGPRNDVAGAYQGVIFAASVGAGLAVTPWAYVSLKVGSSPDAVPEFRVNGVASEYAAFPGLNGSDTGRAPISVDVFNPGPSPLELAAEVGPELWLSLEPGWNSAPIPAGATRTLRLYTRRMRAPNGSALPRYTYLTLRTRGGKTSRLLVQDNDAPLLSAGRGASAVRPEASFLVPSVAHVTSALGNTFVSRLSLSNAGTEAVQAELVFTPASSDSSLVDGFDSTAIRRATVVVPPNDLVRLSDPLVLLFGLTPPVSGTLEVRAPSSRAGFLSVASSVDAPSVKGGTFGFALPVFRSGQGIRAGSTAAITAVAFDSAERTNLILAETTGVDSALAKVSLYDRDGRLVGSENVSVPRWGQRQLSSVVWRLGGDSGSRAGRLEISVESGGGTLAAVTTVVDNFNDDAAAFSARAVDAQGSAAKSLRTLKPVWAKATGTVKSLVPALVNGYRTFPAASEPFTFRSVMGFSSLSTREAVFRLTYYDLASGATVSREVRVPGRRTVEYTNVLEQLFGIGQDVPSQGPLFVESDPQGLLWCRVASSLAQGTIGDSFPVVAIPSESLTGGSSSSVLVLDGLEQSVDRSRGTRSNLILNEVSGRPVSLLVSLYEAGNRSSPIATRQLFLDPLEKVQLSTVFSDLGLDQDGRRKDRTNVLCTVQAISGDGLASAIVTTIDNRTGDTRNIPLAPSASGAPGVSIGF